MVGWICTERRKISVKSESREGGGKGRWRDKMKKIFKSYLQLKKKKEKSERHSALLVYCKILHL